MFRPPDRAIRPPDRAIRPPDRAIRPAIPPPPHEPCRSALWSTPRLPKTFTAAHRWSSCSQRRRSSALDRAAWASLSESSRGGTGGIVCATHQGWQVSRRGPRHLWPHATERGEQRPGRPEPGPRGGPTLALGSQDNGGKCRGIARNSSIRTAGHGADSATWVAVPTPTSRAASATWPSRANRSPKRFAAQ